MNHVVHRCGIAVFASMAFAVSAANPQPASLQDTIAALDSAVFDAFNHCSEPAQLQKHADHFAPDVEFYHDTGGVTWTRDAMMPTPRSTPAAITPANLSPAACRCLRSRTSARSNTACIGSAKSAPTAARAKPTSPSSGGCATVNGPSPAS